LHVTDTGGHVYATVKALPALSSTALALWRVDANGTVAWTTAIAPSGSTDCNGVAVTSDSSGQTVWVAGYVDGTNGKDIMVACYSDNGTSATQQWSYRYNNTVNNANDDDVPVVIYYDQDGNSLYVGGNSAGVASNSTSLGTDMVVLRFNPTSGGGGPSWVQRWDGAAHGNDTLSDLKVIHYIISGSTAVKHGVVKWTQTETDPCP